MAGVAVRESASDGLSMDIVDLKTVPHFLPTLAAWHHCEWAYLNPGRTLEQRIDEMQDELRDALVPSTWVAVGDGVAMGSASIRYEDMDTHPELTPWLASVFVAPEFRRRGIAAKLVERVMSEAQRGDIETLYLFTPDQARLYGSLGWEVIAEEMYRGSTVMLMKVVL